MNSPDVPEQDADNPIDTFVTVDQSELDIHLERDVRADVGETLVSVDDVTVQFGGLKAMDSVSFDIKRGEILGLIGPNGAGKTTCFNAMTGVYAPSSGRVVFDGREIKKLKRYEITRLGIARTFQNIRLFASMTALENVAVGVDARHKTSVVGAVFRSARHRREERIAYDRGMELLEFVGIADRAHEPARSLPYGYQRRLEIARALASDPSLLILDEPAAGMNHVEADALSDLIGSLARDGLTILLIEHNVGMVMKTCSRIVVLNFGQVIATGTPEEIANNPAVVEAYLGSSESEDVS